MTNSLMVRWGIYDLEHILVGQGFLPAIEVLDVDPGTPKDGLGDLRRSHPHVKQHYAKKRRWSTVGRSSIKLVPIIPNACNDRFS